MANSQDLSDLIVKSGLSEFTRNIKLGRFERSYDVAIKTVTILNSLVKDNHWDSARHLIESLKGVCAYIDGLELVETATSNITRRIMRIIRDECQNFSVQMQQESGTSSSQDEAVESNRDETGDTYLDLDLNETGLKENILEGIEQELMNELELSSKSIAQQAVDYVQSDEIILTLGKSRIIESFLKHAAMGGKTGKRRFNVIVVELAPFYSGHELAKSLDKHGIEALIVPDSAVFAIMSRVNKVIIGCHSMMANGGIKAPAGSHSIALAAKHFSVPLIVCCPMFKLTPAYLVSHDSVAFKRFSNLHEAFPEPYTPQISGRTLEDTTTATAATTATTTTTIGKETTALIESSLAVDSSSLSNRGRGSTNQRDTNAKVVAESSPPSKQPASTWSTLESLHSIFDYVPPELITLFVSNIGGNSPSYVYQLLNELYHKSDYLD